MQSRNDKNDKAKGTMKNFYLVIKKSNNNVNYSLLTLINANIFC